MLRLAQTWVLIGALSLVAVGLLGSGLGLVVGLINPETDPLATTTLSLSFLAVTVGLGLALAWQAWQAMQGRRSAAFQPRLIWPLVLAFVLVVGIGQAVLLLDLLLTVTFPLFHVVAAFLPPLIVLALVGRGVRGAARWRDVTLQVSSGALLSTPLAFALEAVVILGLLMAVLIAVAVQPGGPELLQALTARLEDPTWLEEPAHLASLARSPVVMVLAGFILAGVIPLIEEAVKTIGIGLMAYRRPRLPQAFLWGLASGAGFALIEGLFNTTAGLEAWAPVILLRVGATLLHCFTGGLMGLAWYRVLARRQWGRGMGLYAASVGVHSLWNLLTGGMALVSLATLGSEVADAEQMRLGLGVALLLGLLVILTVAVGLALLGLTLYVRNAGRTGHSPRRNLPNCATD